MQKHKEPIFKSKDLMCAIKSLTPQQLSLTSLKETLGNDNINDNSDYRSLYIFYKQRSK